MPATIYGRQAKPQNLELNSKEIADLINHSVSETMLVDLAVADDARARRLALVQDVQHHPLDGKVLHVDFHEVAEDEKVTIMVPLETVGEPAGVKNGGVLEHVRGVLEIESGSATDNPLVFPDLDGTGGDVLSGGNFHGAPLAYAFDYAAIALTDLASMTERRIDRLLNPDINEGLPPFLSPDPGLSSGFMMAQIVAAALINECQVLAHPSSTGSIPTSGGKEDHVSMGMTGAVKLRQIVENGERIAAIELMCAAQGLECRRPLKASATMERAHDAVRAVVPRLDQDRVLAPEIEALAGAVRAGAFEEWCG